MMDFCRGIVTVCGLLFLSITKSSALYCYYCNDFKTGLLNCSDPFMYDKVGVKIQLCPWGSTVCYKYSITHMGHSFYARSCHPDTKLGCYQRENITLGEVMECFCQGHFCNGGAKLTHDHMVSLMTEILIIIHIAIS